tara:strand:+ start:2439 stop:2603 length:165 start_codon:yes stop_codon:yes gene_type:complete
MKQIPNIIKRIKEDLEEIDMVKVGKKYVHVKLPNGISVKINKSTYHEWIGEPDE